MEVERELVLNAPVEEVWEALTDAQRLEEWFANDVELDLERGAGDFRWDSGERRRAELDEVEPGRTLSFRWWDDERPEEGVTTVSFTLVAVPHGTRLVVREATLGPNACAGEWIWALELLPGAVLAHA